MFKIYKQVGKDLYDFTDFCGKIKLRSDSSEISEELSFECKTNLLVEGVMIQLYKDSKLVFKGITVSVDINKNTRNIKAYDYGWYLNKNEEMYQFNASVSNCIRKICNDFGIPIGHIENINVQYKNIHKGNLADIISKILDYATKIAGIKYIWQMRENKFYLEKQSNTLIKYNTNMFGSDINIVELISDASIKRSIENLKNAIKVTQQEDNRVKTLTYRQDSKSINKYGRLQKLEQLEKDKVNNAALIAQNQLKLLNKIDVTVSVTLPGVIDCRANKVLEFNDNIIGIKGKYIIKQCTHNIDKNKHLMDLELEMV